MPTYEYRCEKCGDKFEIRRTMTAPEGKVECPKCKATECHQVYSGLATGSSRDYLAPRRFS